MVIKVQNLRDIENEGAKFAKFYILDHRNVPSHYSAISRKQSICTKNGIHEKSLKRGPHTYIYCPNIEIR